MSRSGTTSSLTQQWRPGLVGASRSSSGGTRAADRVLERNPAPSLRQKARRPARRRLGGRSGIRDVLGDSRIRPTAEQLRAELAYERKRQRKARVLRSTIYVLVVVAAVAVLVSMLAMPVFRVYGSSMSPTLSEGDIAISIKGVDMDTGDLVVFYYENKVLIKRYIAGPGQWVNIDDDGNVYVDGVLLDEPYLSEKALGECDIDLPYQVPEGRIFVLGDHRSTSVDSRSTSLGCVSEEMIVGKIVFRVWPLSGFGAM